MIEPQIPRGSDKLVCPLHKKKMSLVCHKCPFWIQISGKDPNTGETLPGIWNCAIAYIPMTVLEVANKTAGVCANVVSTRDELIKRAEAANHLAAASAEIAHRTFEVLVRPGAAHDMVHTTQVSSQLLLGLD